MVTKEQFRKDATPPVTRDRKPIYAGKVAEILRRAPVYRKAQQLYCDPGSILSQIRVNALLDGKKLIMPSPGLRDGYYVLDPYVIPFRDLSYATTFKGIAKYGTKSVDLTREGLAIDLLITASQAIDVQGRWIGDGLGFFDLTAAIFAANEVLSENASVCVVAEEGKTLAADIEADPWDIQADRILLEASLVETGHERHGWPPIYWDRLPKRRVRKITPLWKVYTAGRDAGTVPDLL